MAQGIYQILTYWILINNKAVTYDLARMMDNAKELKCSEFGKEIVKNF